MPTATTPPPVFGVMGDANMALMAGAAEAGHRLVRCRTEGGAVGGADGWSRATGRPGFATVTWGPGIAQATAMMVASSKRAAPLLLVTGESVDRHDAQHLSGRAWAEMCDVGYCPIPATEPPSTVYERGADAAIARNGPVLVELTLGDTDSAGSAPHPGRRDEAVHRGVELSVHDAAAMVSGADRVVFLIGCGATVDTALPVVLRLAERTRALVATTVRARDAVERFPGHAGLVGLLSSPPARELFAEADLVVAVGARLTRYNLDNGRLFPSANILHIDAEPGLSEPALCAGDLHTVTGDAADVVSALDDALTTVHTNGLRTESALAALAEWPGPEAPAPTDGGIDPRAVCAAVDAALPLDTPVVLGVGHFWSFPIMHLAARPPGTVLCSYDFGMVGQGLPIAIGAAVAAGRCVLFEGDGSLMWHLAELETAARNELDLAVIVMDDRAYGSEYHKLAASGLDEELATFPELDLATVAYGLGAHGVLATSAAQVRDALLQFDERGGTWLIDARISRAVIGEPYTASYLPHAQKPGFGRHTTTSETT